MGVLPVPENSKKPESKQVAAPPVIAPKPEPSRRPEMQAPFTPADSMFDAVKKNVTTIQGIEEDTGSHDEEQDAVQKRKKKNALSTDNDGLSKLHSEYPHIAEVISRFRNAREENPVPNQADLREPPVPKAARVSAKAQKYFEPVAAEKKSLSDALVSVTSSVSALLWSVKSDLLRLNPTTAEAVPGDRLSGINDYFKKAYQSVSHALVQVGKSETPEDEQYKKELLNVLKILEEALLLLDALKRRQQSGELMPSAHGISTQAGILKYRLSFAHDFFLTRRTEEQRAEERSKLQRRIGNSSVVTGLKSEKRKANERTRAQIVDSALRQIGRIIEDEDEYRKRFAALGDGQAYVGTESLRLKYEALRQFTELYGIRPENLLTRKAGGRKSQMTVLSQNIAF